MMPQILADLIFLKIIKDTVTGKTEWEPLGSFGGNTGGWEIVG